MTPRSYALSPSSRGQGGMGGIFLLILQLPPGPQFVAEAQECDKQVATLLTTHDPVDLQRASFLYPLARLRHRPPVATA